MHPQHKFLKKLKIIMKYTPYFFHSFVIKGNGRKNYLHLLPEQWEQKMLTDLIMLYSFFFLRNELSNSCIVLFLWMIH